LPLLLLWRERLIEVLLARLARAVRPHHLLLLLLLRSRRCVERHPILVDHRLQAVRVGRLVAVELFLRRQLPVGHGHLGLELLDGTVRDSD
jgi:hypothetical protein